MTTKAKVIHDDEGFPMNQLPEEIKTRWNRTEVESLILLFGCDVMKWAREYMHNSTTPDLDTRKWMSTHLDATTANENNCTEDVETK